MAMNVGSAKEDEVMVEMNTTPLIDVMLVLLIMLIITIPIQTHAVKLDMPRPNSEKPLVEPEVVDLDIDFDGTISWNKSVVPDMATLNGYLVESARKDPQPELHIRPSKLVKYQYVAAVMSAAQSIGVKKIGMVGSEQFIQQ